MVPLHCQPPVSTRAWRHKSEAANSPPAVGASSDVKRSRDWVGGRCDRQGVARRRQDIACFHPKRSLAISSCPAAVGGHGGRWVISVSSIAEGHKSLQPIPSAGSGSAEGPKVQKKYSCSMLGSLQRNLIQSPDVSNDQKTRLKLADQNCHSGPPLPGYLAHSE